MNAINTPILSISTEAMDRMSFADLHRMRLKLDDLACVVEDGHIADDIMPAVSQVADYVQGREATNVHELLMKWSCVFGFGWPQNDEDLAQFCKEARLFLGGDQS